ncbi:hypothetical protein KY362_03280 [Candidatus Woesearchaeota archaeon]|nr:hypothetical protein [Candidatus Woesearchaeota archaeon]
MAAAEQEALETRVERTTQVRKAAPASAPASPLEQTASQQTLSTESPETKSLSPEERQQLARFVYNRRTDPKKQTPTFEMLGEELQLLSGGKVGSRETARRYFNRIASLPAEELKPCEEPVRITPGSPDDSGIISLYSAEQLKKMPVHVTFEGAASEPDALIQAVETGLDAYGRGDLARYSEARTAAIRLLLGDYYKLADFGNYLATKHMRDPQMTMTGCAGVTGFTVRNGAHPRLYQEMHALLGRVKTFARLGVKYLERQVVDDERATAIEQGKKGSSWKISPNGLYLVHTISDLQALRVKYATREEVLRFGESLDADPRVIVTDVEYHNKPKTGYKGVHWQVKFDDGTNTPLCMEIQGHDAEVFNKAKEDGYHARTKRCMEEPENLIACR